MMTKIAIAPRIPALPLLVASNRKRPELALGLLPPQTVVTPGAKVYTTIGQIRSKQVLMPKAFGGFPE
jgi:hypothetical protein